MGRITDYDTCRMINQNPVNLKNKAYIDRFVSLNYERLLKTFDKQRNTVNSSAKGSIDLLNDVLLSLYTDAYLHFKDQDEANRFLMNKFTDKAIRIVIRKPMKSETDLNETDNQ